MPINTIKTKQAIINEIDEHIKKSLPYSSWYVGIAKDARERLFNDHNVSQTNGFWIYRECENDTISREIELYFLNVGCKGGDGGGDYRSKYVYAYKITNTTIE
jgi:hypothetical protein